MRILERVISGGQTGVDRAALLAAKGCGIPTGGWMPKGWRTLDGNRPDYRETFGMRESPSARYADRTWANVSEAHATLRIARVWNSPGELCTLRAIGANGREHFDTHPKSGKWPVVEWLRRLADGGPIVLNVAGNSEETAPGIEREAFDLLCDVFAEVSPETLVPIPGLTPGADAVDLVRMPGPPAEG